MSWRTDSLEQDSISLSSRSLSGLDELIRGSYLNKTLDIWISPSYLLKLVRVTRHGPVDELIRGSYWTRLHCFVTFDYSDPSSWAGEFGDSAVQDAWALLKVYLRIVSYRSEVTRSSWTAEVVTVVVRVTWTLKLLEPLSVKVEICWIVNLREKPSICNSRTSVTCVFDLLCYFGKSRMHLNHGASIPDFL